MIQPFERFNIDKKLFNLVSATYQKTTFRVRHKGRDSETKQQQTGISPLSPHLFTLVLQNMLYDVYFQHDRTLTAHAVYGVDFTEVCNADDAVPMTKTTRSMHMLLHAIERNSAYYGLILNKGKCKL